MPQWLQIAGYVLTTLIAVGAFVRPILRERRERRASEKRAEILESVEHEKSQTDGWERLTSQQEESLRQLNEQREKDHEHILRLQGLLDEGRQLQTENSQRLDELREEIGDLRVSLGEVTTERALLRQQNEHLQRQNDFLSEQNKQLADQNQHLAEQNKSLAEAARRSAEECDLLKLENVTLKAGNARLEDVNLEYMMKIERLEQRIQDLAEQKEEKP